MNASSITWEPEVPFSFQFGSKACGTLRCMLEISLIS